MPQENYSSQRKSPRLTEKSSEKSKQKPNAPVASNFHIYLKCLKEIEEQVKSLVGKRTDVREVISIKDKLQRTFAEAHTILETTSEKNRVTQRTKEIFRDLNVILNMRNNQKIASQQVKMLPSSRGMAEPEASSGESPDIFAGLNSEVLSLVYENKPLDREERELEQPDWNEGRSLRDLEAGSQGYLLQIRDNEASKKNLFKARKKTTKYTSSRQDIVTKKSQELTSKFADILTQKERKKRSSRDSHMNRENLATQAVIDLTTPKQKEASKLIEMTNYFKSKKLVRNPLSEIQMSRKRNKSFGEHATELPAKRQILETHEFEQLDFDDLELPSPIPSNQIESPDSEILKYLTPDENGSPSDSMQGFLNDLIGDALRIDSVAYVLSDTHVAKLAAILKLSIPQLKHYIEKALAGDSNSSSPVSIIPCSQSPVKRIFPSQRSRNEEELQRSNCDNGYNSYIFGN